MAEVQGRPTDEASSPQSQHHGPEKWALYVGLFLALALVIALLAFAFRG
jgi:hypothetical protein